jgi:hypothetical protein
MSRCGNVFVVLCVLGLVPATSQASLVFYSSRAAFDLDNPGLPVEDFEKISPALPPGIFFGATGPLDSSTDFLGLISPGDILPGLAIQDRPGPDPFSLLVITPGVLPGLTRAVGARDVANPDDSLDLLFSGSPKAVGFDLAAAAGFGNLTNTTIIVDVFGAADVLLGSTTVATLDDVPFLGITSTDAITRINLFSPDGPFEFVDNIAFGAPAAAVPEPSTLLMALAGLTIPGWRVMRRRRSPQPAPELS